ncbi:hypothetical protein OS493_018969 [Desmophyllum pertusum]|uniref:CCHC-type domain-containing protein n=1 Tax=Desmophyllum pertusum TaxID=174260 RepID=A0A9X0CQM7_9CNID|nr:hypothetical protein OS493_018969 [Desmophyllum pertusum]
MKLLGILLVLVTSSIIESLKQCSPDTYSVTGHYLKDHVMSTSITSDISECVIQCSLDIRCKSINFHLSTKSCDLNSADRYNHPEDYVMKHRFLYMDTFKRQLKDEGFKSCAEIQQEMPFAESGYYWIKIGGREAQVYCDMKNYGGGWTLVVSVGYSSIDHFQESAANCLNSILCVPINEGSVIAHKLDDKDIHELATYEGTFRMEVLSTGITAFYQIFSEQFKPAISSCYFPYFPAVPVSSSPTHIPISGRLTAVQVLTWGITFITDVTERADPHGSPQSSASEPILTGHLSLAVRLSGLGSPSGRCPSGHPVNSLPVGRSLRVTHPVPVWLILAGHPSGFVTRVSQSHVCTTMPEVVACPNSLIAFFPRAVYESVGSTLVLPELLQSVSRGELSTVQFLRNGAVRLTFKTAVACDAVVASGIHVHGHDLRVVSVETKSRLIYLRDCPAEVPNSAVSGFFASYGEVHSISLSEHDGFPGLRDGTRIVKMSLTKDVPSVARIAGFDCRVWYRRQPAFCTICKKLGHRGKGCPLNGLCRRCEKPGHVARECRNAWASRSTSVRRPAAPAAPAPAAAPDAAAVPPVAPDVPAPAVAPVAAAVPPVTPSVEEIAMAVSDDDDFEDATDMDYLPGNVEEADASASSVGEFVSGDDEVAAASSAAPSPKRRRRKRKRRGQGPPRPAPGSVPEPGTMDLSLEDSPDAKLIHTYREVWEDTLTWEEIRARKVDMSGFDPSQEPPCDTLELFFETPLPISASTPVPLDSPVPPSIFSDGSSVAPLAVTPVPDFHTRSPNAMHVSFVDGPDANGYYDYGFNTECVLDGAALDWVHLQFYVTRPDLRPPFAAPPTQPATVLPDCPPAKFPDPPDVPQ